MESDIARRDVIPRDDLINETVKNRGSVLLVDNLQHQRHGVRGLTPGCILARLGVEQLSVERRADTFGQSGVLFRIVTPFEEFGGLGDYRDIVIVNRRCGQRFRRQFRLPHSTASQEIEPIAQTVRYDIVLRLASKIIDVAHHRAITIGQDIPVPIPLIEIPRYDHARAAPLGGITKPTAKDDVLGSDIRDETVRLLRFGRVVRDLAVKLRHVVVEHDRRRHQMRDLKPPEFLSMGTIGEHALQIASDSPVDQLMNAIEKIVRTGETPDPFGGTPRKPPFQTHEGRFAIGGGSLRHSSLDLHIAETVIGETGMP